ncbi:MAG: AmmeMemoRadiSam system protein B, partial [Methylococcales bacterium]|nr:AmmeMemoRadiSam system protein B [Methylococcales bacterium]
CSETGDSLPLSLVTDTLAQLDANFLLDNARSQQAIDALHAEWRKQPFRPPVFAGQSYPATEQELSEFLEDFSAETDLTSWGNWQGRALVSPHIDYQRGHATYAQVWARAAAAAQAADLVLIFGTDHKGDAASITLTRQPYATPYGILPTDPQLLHTLTEAIGPSLFDLELNHRKEHAIELSATWLHYSRQGQPVTMLPILVGSFYHFTFNGNHPANDSKITQFVHTLRQATQGKRVLAVASVDLAHIGPAFNSDFEMDEARRKQLSSEDRALQQAIAAGDVEAFYQQIAATHNANNICGFSSIYMLLQYLGDTSGMQIAYQQCPADDANKSVVSICGMLLS